MTSKLSDVQLVVIFALLSRLIAFLSLQLLANLPSFDSSHQLLSQHTPRTLRWDAIHFASIALHGYQYEQQIAFHPGWPATMRLAGEAGRWVTGEEIGIQHVTNGGVLVANLAFIGAGVMLFRLTEEAIGSDFALLTACFYCIPPTPAVLSSPYTEPVYALCTFSGLYLVLKRQYALASISLAGATSTRATGVFTAGVLGWCIVFGDDIPRTTSALARRSLRAIPACTLVIAPFVAFQYYAYISFCSLDTTARSWCNSRLPIPYSFVQGEYWNVGFLAYWTPAQIPNLFIALPVLQVSLTGTYHYLRHFALSSPGKNGYQIPLLLPFHIHHLVMTLLLIFSSHTQIALRVISGDTVFWWNVASMAFDWSDTRGPRKMTTAGKAWVWWTVVWGAVSIVLWAGHYPPA